eukprot:CAMPEP_0184728964 /NCGR_PEP_ID=MMETSP0314-20130426/42544_1 /TAXON_ID=38298 /ORGANISM="Rhodella maculata, Strain CCMP 736" /LENGTH=135 /DNA_ID=CAMNT_0027194921 /DNA_START=232 /DNA_END=635 /DNA_ORIENTATION=-
MTLGCVALYSAALTDAVDMMRVNEPVAKLAVLRPRLLRIHVRNLVVRVPRQIPLLRVDPRLVVEDPEVQEPRPQAKVPREGHGGVEGEQRAGVRRDEADDVAREQHEVLVGPRPPLLAPVLPPEKPLPRVRPRLQ